MYLILPLMALAILTLLGKEIFFLSNFLIWMLVLNIHNKIYASNTGGEFMLNQLLFFNCFSSNTYVSTDKIHNQLKRLLHNFAVVAIIVQVCLAYLLSALPKLQDPSWLNGNAVAQIAAIDHFSLPHLSNNNILYQLALKFLNYVVLLYQLLFPALVFIRKIKKAFLLMGILMHLYIAFVMGLVDFGLIMMLSYLYFWPAVVKNATTQADQKT
jgi:hypothetical protein